MTTIMLTPELVKKIEQVTGTEQTDTETFVEEAVRLHISQFRRNKIRAETKAFDRQYDSLLKKYRGQFVAIHEGQIIGHDPDLRILHLKVFNEFGQIPILLKQVMEQPERELQFRSPRLEGIRT